jgi:uncharacterized membrane protein YidH (DUF202 family)
MISKNSLYFLFLAMIISSHIFKNKYYKTNKKIFFILAYILVIANMILLIYFL